MTAKRELERTFEDMVREIQHLIEQMNDDERRQYLVGKPVPQHRVVRERAARRVHEETDQESNRPGPRVPELPRHPFHLLLAVEHDGHALRRPDGLRLRRSLRQARARATRGTTGCRRSGPANGRSALRSDLNAGGSKFCGDCALKLPAEEGRGAAPAPLERRAAARRGCTSSARPPATSRAPRRAARRRPGITRTRQAGMLDFELFRRVDRRGRPVARPDRLLQLRRGVPAQARHRDVRVHQGEVSRISTSTRARTAWRSPRNRSDGSCTRGSTRSRSRSTARRPESYVKYRQRGDFDKAIRNLTRRGRREAQRRPRRAVHQLALHPLHPQRQRRGDGAGARKMAADIGVDRLCWELTDHPEDMFSRRFLPGTDAHAAIKHEVWDDNNLGNAIPGATPRAAHRSQRAASRACRSSRGRGRPVTLRTTVRNLSTRPFPAQAQSMAGGWCALGAQLCAPRRLARQSGLRARLAARDATAGSERERADDDDRAAEDGPLRPEVRSGQRRDRLVRSVRVRNDDEVAGSDLGVADLIGFLIERLAERGPPSASATIASAV